MLIGIDGACKRNGQETCSSTGVAWIQTEDGNLLYKSRFETKSTSQRGEINGLYEALLYAEKYAGPDEDIVIVTDSAYLHNSVTYEWCNKWSKNNWYGSTGPVKNADQWSKIVALLETVGDRVYMQWTKGHLMSYTPSNIRAAMKYDAEGIELFERIKSIASRPAEFNRIAREFNSERTKHEYNILPEEVAVEWVSFNVMADSLASYIEKMMDEQLL